MSIAPSPTDLVLILEVEPPTMAIAAIMNQPLPPVIFLDAVGTLFGIRGSVGEIYGRFAGQVGIQVDADPLNQAFLKSFQSAPKPSFTDLKPGALGEQEFAWWQAIAAQSFERIGVLDQFADFSDFFKPLYDYFATADPWFVYSDVPPALAYWRSQGVKLGILSNFDSRLYQVVKALDLDPYFSSITISTAVGAAKPDPEIFRVALAQYSYDPPKVWHIGDSFSEDYQGAQAAGLVGIWLKREPPLLPEAPASEPAIADLRALLPASPQEG